MLDRKIAITATGMISAAGAGYGDTASSFDLVKRNAGPVTIFDTPLAYPVFEATGLPSQYLYDHQRSLGLAMFAIDEALSAAGLRDTIMHSRTGIAMGTTVASQLNDLEFYRSYRDTGSASMEPVDRYVKGNLATAIARKLRLNGPRMTVVNACSSGTDAIGIALSWLRGGLCDIAIAGGADELSRIPLCGFGSLGLLNPGLCSPFDRDRKGLNLGEGAGVLILETLESASRRGIKPALFLRGYGSSADAYHLTAPHPEGIGLIEAIRRALFEAGINPSDVSFINAHGTGTTENDKVEGMVLAKLFGPDVKALSTKGYTGHTLGAAGGLEAAFCAMGLREGWIPASAGFENRDEDIPLTPVTARTSIEGRYALSTSLAFGGNNAAIVIERYAE